MPCLHFNILTYLAARTKIIETRFRNTRKTECHFSVVFLRVLKYGSPRGGSINPVGLENCSEPRNKMHLFQQKGLVNWRCEWETPSSRQISSKLMLLTPVLVLRVLCAVFLPLTTRPLVLLASLNGNSLSVLFSRSLANACSCSDSPAFITGTITAIIEKFGQILNIS